jgi:hypothetical protein
MNTDAHINSGMADLLSIEMMLKATPSEERGKRFIYLEASREERDQHNEVVLAKALEDSADHYLKFGNIDLDHKTMPAVAKLHGITRPDLWEIGAPVEVRVDGISTFVKAELFTGATDLAEKANMVWDSMTKLQPARKWYPSVGGKIMKKSMTLDEKSGDKIAVVSGVRWTNIALSQHPVNQHVGGIATIPFGVLAKSWSADGLDIAKALEASYATDAGSKTGGAAFGQQSLDTGRHAPASYFEFREGLAGALRSGAAKDQSANGLVQYATGNFSLSHDEAADWVDRFLSDLKSGRTKQTKR